MTLGTAFARIGAALAIALVATISSPALAHDDLLSAVPAQAAVVVALDHQKLSAHPNYGDIIKLLEEQGWGVGLSSDPTSPLAPGKTVMRSVSFRMANDDEGAILAGKLDMAAVEAHAKAKLGAGFETGEEGGKRWFSAGKGLRAVDLGDGRLALADKGTIGKVIGAATGKGKAMGARGDFKSLAKEARKGTPPVWGVAFMPASTKKRLEAKGSTDIALAEKVSFRAVGASDVTFDLVAHTKDEASAQKLADGVNGKIERKVLGSSVLKALGVAALAEKTKLTARGKTAVGSVNLSAAQVGLLSKVLGKVLVALR